MARIWIASIGLALLLLPTAGVARDGDAYAPQPARVAPAADGTIQYFISEGTQGSAYRTGDAELAAWALQEWQRSSGGVLRFAAVDGREEAAIRFEWLPWAEDAALGRMEPSVENGRWIATLLIRPDEANFRPSIKRRVRADPLMRDVVLYYVCLHEIGHALGLDHSSDLRDIMWSGGSGVTLPVYDRYRKRLRVRADIPAKTWLSPGDIDRLMVRWRRDPRG